MDTHKCLSNFSFIPLNTTYLQCITVQHCTGLIWRYTIFMYLSECLNNTGLYCNVVVFNKCKMCKYFSFLILLVPCIVTKINHGHQQMHPVYTKS
jgi:hypothetical protein